MSQQQSPTPTGRTEVIKYFVNGEQIEHTFEKPADRRPFQLTVRTILESAGFAPPEDYELTRDADAHTFDDLLEEVVIINGERFTATFKGPTPTS